MNSDQRPIGELLNLGPKSAAWLQAVGIRTIEDLRAIGAVDAYHLAKAREPSAVSLNLLWSLQAGLLDMPYTQLPKEVKAELLRELEAAERIRTKKPQGRSKSTM